MRVLALGGSGWIGSAFVCRAIATGHSVTVVSRGLRPVAEGASHIRVDRDNEEAFQRLVMGGLRFTDGGEGGAGDARYDFVVDFMGAGQKHGVQMLAIDAWGVPNVFVSTDLVYSPRQSRYPLQEHTSRYQPRFCGGKKYQLEWLFTSGSSERYTVVIRPGYVYGPGRPLGPLPPHLDDERLVERLRAGESITLPAGGSYLLQPLYIDDLVETILALATTGIRAEQFNVAGPEIVEAREFYAAIARALGAPLRVNEVSAGRLQAEHPEWEQYMRNRLMDLSSLKRSGLPVPSTPPEEGIAICLGSP